MRILYVWDADYPWDIRAEKVTRSLIDAGHATHLLARNRRRLPRKSELAGLTIHRLPALPACFGPLNDLFTFPAFFSPVWLAQLLRVVHAERIELLIVRDLPLAPAVVALGRLLAVPVVFDMAECYPEMLRNLTLFAPPRLLNRVVRNPRVAAVLERWVVRRAARVLVMIEESRDRLLGFGVEPERVRIVSNTPDPVRFVAEAPPAGRPFTVTYIGLLGFSRGLDRALAGLARYLQLGGKARFLIAGTGRARATLEARAEQLGIAAQVDFLGWVDNARLPGLVFESDVCIVPHRRCPHWEHTIPNKLFDYMAAGRPVLVTDVRPMARIVERTGCGLIYRDDDPDSLAAALRQLEDERLRRRLGANGREAVEREFNWERDRAVLLETVREFERPPGVPAAGAAEREVARQGRVD